MNAWHLKKLAESQNIYGGQDAKNAQMKRARRIKKVCKNTFLFCKQMMKAAHWINFTGMVQNDLFVLYLGQFKCRAFRPRALCPYNVPQCLGKFRFRRFRRNKKWG